MLGQGHGCGGTVRVRPLALPCWFPLAKFDEIGVSCFHGNDNLDVS